MKNEALFSIQKAEPDEVAVDEIKDRPDEWRKAAPDPFPKSHGIACLGRSLVFRIRSFSSLKLFLRLKSRIPVVFGNPGRNIVLITIVFNQIAFDFGSPALDPKVVI